MRYPKMIVAMAVFASLASSLSPFAVAAEETDDSPKQFIKSWATSFNKNDPKLILAFYEQSEEIDVIMSAGVRYHGYKAVQKIYVNDHRQVRFYDSKLTDISTRILGDTVLVTFEHQFKIRFAEDASRWQVHIRTTSVLNRIDGKWKIVLEHSSPIRGTERYTQIQAGKQERQTNGYQAPENRQAPENKRVNRKAHSPAS